MNFLAHCDLADDAATAWAATPHQRDGLLAGAVIGDFVKGTIAADWPTALRAGVRLHRKIDALSNRNDAISETCSRFPQPLRRFAPIFVDILADHWLSLSWPQQHPYDLGDFAQECYHALDEYREYLDPRGQRFVAYMVQENLLSQFHQWVHVEQALRSVLRRLDKTDDFDQANAAMRSLVRPGYADFETYYPQLSGAFLSWNAFDAIATNS